MEMVFSDRSGVSSPDLDRLWRAKARLMFGTMIVSGAVNFSDGGFVCVVVVFCRCRYHLRAINTKHKFLVARCRAT
jgi:hypothetical protein